MNDLIKQYGNPNSNPLFWSAIDPLTYLPDITTPIQLNTGGSDEEVPPFFSANLKTKLKKLGKNVSYYYYPGMNHNISFPNFPSGTPIAIPYEIAMQNGVKFFDTYLK